METSNPDETPVQQTLEQQDVDTSRWMITVEDSSMAIGGEKLVVIADSYRQAEEVFHEEYQLYEATVETHEYEWDHVSVYAPDESVAKDILMSRDRDRRAVTSIDALGNDAEVIDVAPVDEPVGKQARQARRDMEAVRADN